jgi:hypothetical protein
MEGHGRTEDGAAMIMCTVSVDLKRCRMRGVGAVVEAWWYYQIEQVQARRGKSDQVIDTEGRPGA